MLLHPSPCLSRPQEPQTTDPSVEHLIGDLIAATACRSLRVWVSTGRVEK
jgi:hypothetical protein